MQVIRLSSVIEATGLGRSSIYKYVSEGKFPKPVSLGDRAVGWVSTEIDQWIRDKIGERDSGR